MSQATDWSVPLSGPVTPNTMADRMDKSLDALLSFHSGASRPAYAVAGTIWVSTATAGQHKYYHYDGTTDRLLFTVNTATGAVTFGDPGQEIHDATSKTALADADELGLADSAASWAFKKVTLTNLIASIFKTTRTIANAQFAAATFKLFNAAGTPRALSFVTTALTADRTITMPNANVDLGNMGIKQQATVALSGTAFDITGIPANVKRVTLLLDAVALSASGTPLVQIGSSTGIVSTGYEADAISISSTPNASSNSATTGHILATSASAAFSISGKVVLENVSGNKWLGEGQARTATSTVGVHSSKLTLPGVLDRVRITTTSGTPTLSGNATISWEF